MSLTGRHSRKVLLGAVIFVSAPVAADLLDDARAAVAEGDGDLTARYRYEYVDQDGFDEDAHASTLRARFTWTSGAVSAFTAGFEADYVSVIGRERYDSTANGKAEYPVVPDPEGFDLNQAFVRYAHDAFTVTGGRQRILHADQRFVGGVGWRQNEQTFDALRIEARPTGRLVFDYAYVANVNRIFGPEDGGQPADWQGDSQLLNARFEVGHAASVGAFVYRLEFDDDNGPGNSNATYGIEARGTLSSLSWSARLARQTDHGDNPADYEADYASLDATLALAPLTLNAGYEVLGSDDGAAAFTTPLATLHKFQGWADRFLATPPAGIRDAYAGASRKLGTFTLAASYHDFDSDDGGDSYGRELDVAVTWTPRPGVSVQLKLADYSSDGFAADTTKAWLTVEAGL